MTETTILTRPGICSITQFAHNVSILTSHCLIFTSKIHLNFLYMLCVPRFIRGRFLCKAIGLGGAVSRAVLWTDFFFSAICGWELQAGPDTLPLLCSITDCQTPLLLDEQNTHTNIHRTKKVSSVKSPEQDRASMLIEPLCVFIRSQKSISFLPSSYIYFTGIHC